MTDYSENPVHEINPIWNEPDLKDLRKFRELKDEDLPIVESLIELPKEIAVSHHNFFSFSRENTIQDLEKEIAKFSTEEVSAQDEYKKSLEEKIKYANLFRDIASKYDWTTAWGVNTVLERRKPKDE